MHHRHVSITLHRHSPKFLLGVCHPFRFSSLIPIRLLLLGSSPSPSRGRTEPRPRMQPTKRVSLFQIVHFYRAKLRVARYCQGKLSVCLSVCLSLTLRYRGHIGWNSWKIISRLINLTLSLSADPNMTDFTPKGREHHKF